MIKPMLASDWDESKVRFPIMVQPKIDGVRALNISGTLTGRSLKQHRNRHVTQMFSRPEFVGLDGEMIAGTNPTDSSLCRMTTSALSTIEGQPKVVWYLFDIVDLGPGTNYITRYKKLQMRVEILRRDFGVKNVEVVPSYMIEGMSQLEEAEQYFVNLGYEGIMLRDPQGQYKSGRSTVREGGLLRVKRFVEEEAYVVRILEGQSNQNEAITNALGQTERSTHSENMIPNGMVGALECKDIKTGESIKVAAGCMTHDMRRHYFENQDQILGKVIRYKMFEHGRKDLPRFPTFQGIRMESDR